MGTSGMTIQQLYNSTPARREGVIKIVSLKPPEEMEQNGILELANDNEEENGNGGKRVKDGLLAWIVNLGKVGDVSFTSVIELHGLPNEFLRKGRESESELEKIAGEDACGAGVLLEDPLDTEPPEETQQE